MQLYNNQLLKAQDYVLVYMYTTAYKHMHMLMNIIIAMYVPGLKVGRMTWVTWVTFLEGQVGLIRRLNYLDVTRISHVL